MATHQFFICCVLVGALNFFELCQLIQDFEDAYQLFDPVIEHIDDLHMLQDNFAQIISIWNSIVLQHFSDHLFSPENFVRHTSPIPSITTRIVPLHGGYSVACYQVNEICPNILTCIGFNINLSINYFVKKLIGIAKSNIPH